MNINSSLLTILIIGFLASAYSKIPQIARTVADLGKSDTICLAIFQKPYSTVQQTDSCAYKKEATCLKTLLFLL
jgi:mannose/fructose/N-acetylgalactosamine-specific phosphotransferase system component IIC